MRSVSISATERMVKTVSGPDTCGLTSARSSSIRAAYVASGSGTGGSRRHASTSAAENRSMPDTANRSRRSSRNSSVTGSTGNHPTNAPHSVVMLAIAIRASIPRPATPSPVNSTAAFRTSPWL